MAEHGIDNLGVMTNRHMDEFGTLLEQFHWCQHWCKDTRNMLVMHKLGQKLPAEHLIGNTPDMSLLRFYIWEKASHLNPKEKQSRSRHKLAQFLSIAWNYSNNLYYQLRTVLMSKSKRQAIIIRSVVRLQGEIDKLKMKADLSLFHIKKDNNMRMKPPPSEPNLPLPRVNQDMSTTTISSGEKISASQEHRESTLSLQEVLDSESEDDLLDAEIGSLLKDGIAEVDLAFEDNEKKESRETSTPKPEIAQIAIDNIDLKDF